MIVRKTIFLFALPQRTWNFELAKDIDSVNYMAWPYSTYGAMKAIDSIEVEFDVEGFDPVQLRIQQLEIDKKRIQAEFTARITDLERQINECLAIEG